MQLTAQRLRALLHYDAETGAWIWLVNRGGRAKAGSPAGSPNSDGYLQIMVDGILLKAHVLAWLYMTGEWPVALVDHRDTDRANNRWANLREATYEQNAQNGPAHCDSKTGLRGVSWHKRLKKFQAEITAGGVRRHLGYFDTREAAAVARDQAAATYHGEFVRFTVLRA